VSQLAPSNPVWYGVLLVGLIVAGAAVSLSILWLGPGMPLTLLAAVPFIVGSRFAWTRAGTPHRAFPAVMPSHRPPNQGAPKP
jgi:hypothetical protein